MNIQIPKRVQTMIVGALFLANVIVPQITFAALLDNSVVKPESVVVNSSNVLFARLRNTSSESTKVLVDLELYDASGNRVGQNFVDNVTFAAGDQKDFTMTTPAGLPAGTYIFDIGIFKPAWGETLYWDSDVGEVTINESADGSSSARGTLALVDSSQFDETITSVGHVNSLTADFEAQGGDARALFDLELYNQDGVRVGQSFFDNTLVANGERYEQYLDMNNLPAGNYQWKTGIFTSGWGSVIAWYENAGTFTVRDSATTTPPVTNESLHNGSVAVSMVDIPKENIHEGDMPSISAHLISQNGENANNVMVTLRLIDSEDTVVAEQKYSGQDILHEGPKTYSLEIPGTIGAGEYQFSVEVVNQDGSINHTFGDLGTVAVEARE